MQIIFKLFLFYLVDWPYLFMESITLSKSLIATVDGVSLPRDDEESCGVT